MQVAVVGTGYVGLVTGVCLAELGHSVIACDLDAEKIARINRGEPTIHESGLEALLRRHLATGRFRATASLDAALQDAAASIIAVGTPFHDTHIDLGAVRSASQEIGARLRTCSRYHVVIVKSTVVPGTTEEVVRPILEEASGKRAGPDFGLCMNPEFLTEGRAVRDFLEPDRIVIGSIDERSGTVLEELYAGLGAPIVRTDPRTAEMIKYVSNAMLATAISFSNEMADLCDRLGIDVVDVMRGVHLSQYLSPALPDGGRIRAPLAAFFEAGCGFGGSCLPKDVKALVAHAATAGVPMRVLQAVLDVNASRTEELLALLKRHYPSLTGTTVAVLGLAFKPDTDDTRESPGVRVVHRLAAEGATVHAYDPAARPALNGVGPGRIILSRDLESAIDGADAILITTRWEEFRALPDLLRERPRQPLVVDGRRLLDAQSIARYEGIGRSRLD